MNRRILLQVATPAVFVGVVLLAACLASAWYVNRLQTNMSRIVAENVTSLSAAQQMEISVRQLRFHCFVYLLAPDPTLETEMASDHARFEHWLALAEETSYTDLERNYVEAVREGYARYRKEFERLREEAKRPGPRRDFRQLAEANPLRHVLEPCQAYLVLNEEMMAATEQESHLVSRRLRGALLLIGLGGPVGGLLSGYGIARGLSRSLRQLSVRVHAVAQHLQQDVGELSLSEDGDLGRLDTQLRHVVNRVAEVGQRLQRQQQEVLRAQQLAAVGQLAASVAHEVRNPLTAIKLLVEAALRSHKPRPFTDDNLRIVHGEILRLEQTVQGLLDFARPPAIRPEVRDVRKVVDQAVDLVRARARQQRVQVKVKVSEQPIHARVDAGQFCTVLVNLLMNALDVMPEGGALDVHLEGSQEEISLSIADTGPGIASEVLEHLFTPFVSTKATGTGLGLSISRRVVEGHGGSIQAVNQASGGARFIVTLPCAREERS